MAGRHGYPQQQQQQQQQQRGGGDAANGEAPGSPPSALSFLHGLSDDPLHGDPTAGGVDSMPVQGAGPDALGMSARLERERKRRREQQEEAALHDFLSGCPSTGDAEYPFAAAPSQGDLFRSDPMQYSQPQLPGQVLSHHQQQPAALLQPPGSYPGMAQHGGATTIVGYPVQARLAQPAFGQLPPIPPAADAAWVYPQDDRHTSSNGQDAHGAGSGGRAGHSRGRVGAAAADDVPGSSKAEREKARRERLNESFNQLAELLDSEKASRMDKVTIISDAVKAVTQLRAEAHQLRQFKKLLEERMADTERENAELKMREALVLRFSQTGLAAVLPGGQAPSAPGQSAQAPASAPQGQQPEQQQQQAPAAAPDGQDLARQPRLHFQPLGQGQQQQQQPPPQQQQQPPLQQRVDSQAMAEGVALIAQGRELLRQSGHHLTGDFGMASSSKEDSPSPMHRQGSGAQWGQPDVKPYSPRRGASMQIVEPQPGAVKFGGGAHALHQQPQSAMPGPWFTALDSESSQDPVRRTPAA